MKKPIFFLVFIAILTTVKAQKLQYDWFGSRHYWVLSSVPGGQDSLFPGGKFHNDLRYGYNRAGLSWYYIDNLFYKNNSYTPQNINNEMLSKHSMREVKMEEVFPSRQYTVAGSLSLRTFDLAFYPKERGPYNFDYKGINVDGTLKNPNENWAGIMRRVESYNFEAANIEYIEFMLMDPFLDNPGDTQNRGEMYIHLGDVSEDILSDGVKQYENGLPKEGNSSKVIQTVWGYAPSSSPINYSFDNYPEKRKYQDIGLDGLSDNMERGFFYDSFLYKLKSILEPEAYEDYYADPSADNYHFFRDEPESDFEKQEPDILFRYKYFNNPEGNSPISTGGNINTTGSLSPDVEDINNDFTLSQIESYYQYKIDVYENMIAGENYIFDKHIASVLLPNGKTAEVPWYKIKIPVNEYSLKIGPISDFKNIRFFRIVFKGFNNEVVLRLKMSESSPIIKQTIKVYPNPSYGEISVYIGNVVDPKSISITDITGRIVYHEDFNHEIDVVKRIQFDNRIKGIFFLTVQTSEEVIIKKIICL